MGLIDGGADFAYILDLDLGWVFYYYYKVGIVSKYGLKPVSFTVIIAS